jgi:hypothetical protein
LKFFPSVMGSKWSPAPHTLRKTHFDREIERGASFLRQMVQGGGAELLTP